MAVRKACLILAFLAGIFCQSTGHIHVGQHLLDKISSLTNAKHPKNSSAKPTIIVIPIPVVDTTADTPIDTLIDTTIDTPIDTPIDTITDDKDDIDYADNMEDNSDNSADADADSNSEDELDPNSNADSITDADSDIDSVADMNKTNETANIRKLNENEHDNYSIANTESAALDDFNEFNLANGRFYKKNRNQYKPAAKPKRNRKTSKRKNQKPQSENKNRRKNKNRRENMQRRQIRHLIRIVQEVRRLLKKGHGKPITIRFIQTTESA